MALARTGYTLDFREISPDAPQFGTAATIPWDSQTFGFIVASYRAGEGQVEEAKGARFRNLFRAWMEDHGVRVCACVVPPTASFWRKNLAEAGFEFVDTSLQVTLADLTRANLPATRSTMRAATLSDHPSIEAIAGGSFSHGRYHADPRFPEELANRRYEQWVRNALVDPNPDDRMYVLEDSGKIAGFFHVTVEDRLSDLRLAAVAQEFKATMIGVELYVAMLYELRRLGVRKVITSISAMNTGIVSLYGMLGFRFSHPEIVYHWHAPAGDAA